MPHKKRVTIDLKPAEYQDLLKLKDRLARPLTWLGRRTVREFLEKHRDQFPDSPTYFLVEESGAESKIK